MWGKVSCLRKHWDVETRGAYHLAKISENSGLNANGKAIFWKFQSKILDYLLRDSFSGWNEAIENFLTI